MNTFISHDFNQTEMIGQKLAKKLKKGDVVAFFGGLGMGKTAFVRGLAKGLSINENVSSPTFSIVHDYGGNPALIHFDMYRVNTWEDLNTTGFFDYLDLNEILAIEWSENIESALPQNSIYVEISKGESDNDRIIKITGENIDENFFD
ncbi:MAG: tRNA (adenosine(37)-N6)-threonylcarbamoyltransferase complex ATPase subunit type 1 TsaE [Clostridiales bacterium]|nr:tRNA (adenosine(37)-N6)-threonylcarbamoyltransferase complex ATPase subunit type 1 TsaE [Clostridiales bacterium]